MGAVVTEWVTIFAASFVFVSLKAFQQLNVQHNRRWWIMPTSMLMAVSEVVVVVGVAKSSSLLMAIPLGVGAGCGCLLAMSIHGRLRK